MRKLLRVFCSLILLMSMGISIAGVFLETLEGDKISFEDLKGKWIFINYWASWCGPCVAEIAELNRFYEKHQADVEVFAVNFDGFSLARQRKMIQKFAIHYPSLNPRSLAALHLDDISVVPVTYVFDPTGHLQETLYGGQTRRSLQRVFAEYKKQDE